MSGLGPLDVKIGDEICAILGETALYVLRETGNQSRGGGQGQRRGHHPRRVGSPETLKRTGDAFVHDLTFGEASTTDSRGPERQPSPLTADWFSTFGT